MLDLINRQAAIDHWRSIIDATDGSDGYDMGFNDGLEFCISDLSTMPSAQPTLYGYNIEHLELIARILQKENLPLDRVVEALTDIDKIVAIVRDEFEKTLRKAVEQCAI